MNSQSNFSIHLVYGPSVFNDCFTNANVFQSISHIFSGIPIMNFTQYYEISWNTWCCSCGSVKYY